MRYSRACSSYGADQPGRKSREGGERTGVCTFSFSMCLRVVVIVVAAIHIHFQGTRHLQRCDGGQRST